LVFGTGCVLLVTGEALLWVASQWSPQVTSNLMWQRRRFWCCLRQFALFVGISCRGCVQCGTLCSAAMAVYMDRNIFWKALSHVSHSVSVTLSLLTSLMASSVCFWEASKQGIEELLVGTGLFGLGIFD
jgi:hypothetical protein